MLLPDSMQATPGPPQEGGPPCEDSTEATMKRPAKRILSNKRKAKLKAKRRRQRARAGG